MRESRGRTRHAQEGNMKPLEASTGEEERGQSRPRGGIQEEGTRKLPCYRVVGAGLGTPPEENPKPLEDMDEGKGKERQFADVPEI
jgi:hypothetical protein